ncbi:MAG: amidohydrolase family protein [Trueperaceae bacterium]|nr:amidohydrolase family protein [Trueperaceae bacterium]
MVHTMDPRDTVIPDGGVAIRDGRIVGVDESRVLRAAHQAKTVVETSGSVILPGLVDAYGHAGHGLIRGLFDAKAGWPSGRLYWHATTLDWWYAESMLSATERLRFGVTTGQSIVGATPARMDSPAFAEQVARAYSRVGVRAVLGVGPPDPVFSHLEEPWSASTFDGRAWTTRTFSYEDAVRNSIDVIERWHGGSNGLVRVALAPPYLFGRHVGHRRTPHDLPTAADARVMLEHAAEMRDVADRYGVIVHTHMFAGSVDFALEHFGAAEIDRLLGPDVVIAHGNGLRPREVEILGEHRCSVATVAYTHENVWYGFAPVPELLDAGANVVIATDGTAPYTSYDLLREPARALWHQWMKHGRQDVVSHAKALRMITIDAAHALGLGSEVGSLEVGKRADVIVLGFDRPHLTPMTSVEVLLTHYASGHDVDTVVVDGTILMLEGKITSVDVAEVLARAREEAELAFERADVSRYRRDGGTAEGAS